MLGVGSGDPYPLAVYRPWLAPLHERCAKTLLRRALQPVLCAPADSGRFEFVGFEKVLAADPGAVYLSSRGMRELVSA